MLSSRKIEGEKLTFFCIQGEQDTVLGILLTFYYYVL